MPRDGRDRSDPFEQLERSHRRLREELDALRDAAAALRRDPGDAAARARVGEVADFVERTVVRHERDEEESLFPRLRAHPELAARCEALAGEHREHEALHAELRALADELAGGGGDVARLADLSARLDAAYDRHVEVEEGELFPAARAVLGEDERRAAAAEMQARRGR